jgi:hypothetical protein
MTIPAHEMRTTSSWRGLTDLAMKICDKYRLPYVMPEFEFVLLIKDGVAHIFSTEAESWLFV